MLNRTKVI